MTIEVTKKSVTKPREGMFSITLNLQLLEDVVVVFDKDFTRIHKVEKTVAQTLAAFQNDMQKAIDFYKSGDAIFDSASLNTAVTTLQSNLTY